MKSDSNCHENHKEYLLKGTFNFWPQWIICYHLRLGELLSLPPYHDHNWLWWNPGDFIIGHIYRLAFTAIFVNLWAGKLNFMFWKNKNGKIPPNLWISPIKNINFSIKKYKTKSNRLWHFDKWNFTELVSKLINAKLNKFETEFPN